jgi:flagellar basal-body rod protein FlgF
LFAIPMNDIQAILLSSMQGDVSRLERIASNLANATTPGYKRELWVQRVASVEAEAGGIDGAGLAADNSAQAPAADKAQGSARDGRVGTMKPTGQPLDIAIAGDGYLEVMHEQGTAYTRHGQLRVDERGRLVTAAGHAVIGQGGEITLTTSAVRIDAAGRIFEGEREVGRLKLVTWDRPDAITPIGGGAFAASGTPQPVSDGDVAVRQGFLENANVNTATEMVELTQTMRHFESILRMAQGRDEMLGIALRKLGEN